MHGPCKYATKPNHSKVAVASLFCMSVYAVKVSSQQIKGVDACIHVELTHPAYILTPWAQNSDVDRIAARHVIEKLNLHTQEEYPSRYMCQ